MIYLLFGEMGIGKNHVGEMLAGRLGCKFFDGDSVVPDYMVRKVARFKPLLMVDIDLFVEKNLIPAITRWAGREKDVVVGQALYMQKHRDQIRDAFGKENVTFVHVISPFLTHMKRLWNREKGHRWVIYALMNKPFFQMPEGAVLTIDNGPGVFTPSIELDRLFP